MRSLQTAALVTVLVIASGGGLFVVARRVLGPDFFQTPAFVTTLAQRVEPRPRVLVLIVRDRGFLDEMRRSIAAERIVASTQDAFAVAEGRIVTTGIEAASAPLSQAGWIDADLEFLDTGDLRGRLQPRAQSEPGRDLSDLSDLYSRSRLSVGEAIRVLNHTQ